MEIRLATTSDIEKLSKLSVRLGNVPFFPSQCKASLLLDDEGEIAGFVAVQIAWHAAGSWVREDHRKQGRTYEMRNVLDNELRRCGIGVYFAIPSNDFEKQLFAKYGHVTESFGQVRHL